MLKYFEPFILEIELYGVLMTPPRLKGRGLCLCDKTMIYNAQKTGLKAYHLVEDIDKIIDLLKS